MLTRLYLEAADCLAQMKEFLPKRKSSSAGINCIHQLVSGRRHRSTGIDPARLEASSLLPI
jgi:hypothetical protein